MKQTRKEVEAELKAAKETIHAAEICLRELVAGNVRWFGRGEFRLAVVRPHSPCGGYCLTIQNEVASAHYFDEFAEAQLNHIQCVITGHDTEDNRSLMARRETINKAKEYIHAVNHQATAP